MAKKDSIHPKYNELEVIMTNGETFKTRSTYSGKSLKLDIDIKSHPAWNKGVGYVNTKADEISNFNDRYSGLDFMKKKD